MTLKEKAALEKLQAENRHLIKRCADLELDNRHLTVEIEDAIECLSNARDSLRLMILEIVEKCASKDREDILEHGAQLIKSLRSAEATLIQFDF